MSLLANLLEALTGRPPIDYQPGQMVELETRNGRLVRGTVMATGRGGLVLDIGTDTLRVALVRAEDVTRHRPADADAPAGNWHQGNPDRVAATRHDGAPWTAA